MLPYMFDHTRKYKQGRATISNELKAEMQNEIGYMMLITAVIETLLLILVLVFFRDRPLERIEINLEED
jgi:hypothetical protein